MPKQFLEDMVRAKRQREAKNVAPKIPAKAPEVNLSKREIKQEASEEEKEVRPRARARFPAREVVYSPRRSRYLLWFVALISVTFCLAAVSIFFGRAIITVEPKIKEVTLNENLSASRESNGDELKFDLVVIKGDESQNLEATGEKEVRERASGAIVLYNNFSTLAQALSIDTRLEGSNGKIYKTATKSVVPGKNGNTPGSVEVNIYAAEAGDSYNSPPLDFKILGFKGTPKYSGFYGRSKGEIAGGYIGKVPDVGDSEKQAALSSLKEKLKQKLFKNAVDQTPEGYILFKDAVFLDLDNITSNLSIDPVPTMKLGGTLYGFLLSKEKLTEKISKKKIEGYDPNDSIYVPHIEELTFALGSKDSASFYDTRKINFNLSGTGKIVWKIDVEKFVSQLLGTSKKDFNQILSAYPNVDSATLSLSPIWKMSIPEKINNIKVIVNYPK